MQNCDLKHHAFINSIIHSCIHSFIHSFIHCCSGPEWQTLRKERRSMNGLWAHWCGSLCCLSESSSTVPTQYLSIFVKLMARSHSVLHPWFFSQKFAKYERLYTFEPSTMINACFQIRPALYSVLSALHMFRNQYLISFKIFKLKTVMVWFRPYVVLFFW